MAQSEKLEGEPIELSQGLTTPKASECLFCYVYRMLASHGCNGKLHWAAFWRDLRAPRATALERRLSERGGYCDCEIFMNGWTPSEAITKWDPETEDEIWPDPMLSCPGVRPRSSQSCSLWQPMSRREGW